MADDNTLNFKTLREYSYLYGGNATYVEELYEQYLQNSDSVSKEWQQYFASVTNSHDTLHEEFPSEIRKYFQQLGKHANGIAAFPMNEVGKLVEARMVKLINSYRRMGHLYANLDPLHLHKKPYIERLEPSYYDLDNEDQNKAYPIMGFTGVNRASIKNMLAILKQTYCGSVGFQYMYINTIEELNWLRERWESIQGQASFSKQEKLRILQKLVAAIGLEIHLGSKYVGQKRFSVEGGATLIPVLDTLVQKAGADNVKEIVLGMAHRGRLNVLVNILGKSPSELFDEFEGKKQIGDLSGDVKYHQGFSSDIKTEGGALHLALAFNPSHLEIIAPVIEGSVRSRQSRYKENGQQQILPIIVHGDAAISGQGVVMETMNMSQTRGFSTGGTIHIVINNQIGFTTSRIDDARSTLYCTDIAKMIDAPVFHVNADDPEAAVLVTNIAFEYRQKFNKDVVIDLICYRRHGHNEADEPSSTQPIMYQAIKSLHRPHEIYGEKLVAEHIIGKDDVNTMMNQYRDTLNKGKPVVAELLNEQKHRGHEEWAPFLVCDINQACDTGVNKKILRELAEKIAALPENFVLQAQVDKLMHDRAEMTAGKMPLNWGYAEIMAYATLLHDGYPIRFAGQDSGRGTFSHRHAVLHDQKSGNVYTPLQHISAKQPRFEIIDSLLSEEAVVAFEYGYATADPSTLTLWEAQFGDFVNGAQVVIDQFISSGEQKWGRLCGLVMLLPHGYDGMGPEHSSARLERFLQLCAQQNMQVCVPTTPAQIFHLLRRQMLRMVRKPLIIMSPKSLLRHKLAISSLDDLAKGEFQLMIAEVDPIKTEKVTRVVLCSGKVYYDLLEYRRQQKIDNVVIIRIEQLYPFPIKELTDELLKFKKAKQVIWCQEEPMNQGAWYSSKHNMTYCLSSWQQLDYAGRNASASPATGYAALHHKEQTDLIKQALQGSE